MDLCPVTFRSFVVQWSAKIAGCWPQLKPLYVICVLPFTLIFKLGRIQIYFKQI